MDSLPQNYFRYHMNVLQLLGINIYDIQHPLFKCLYNFYAFALFVFTFLLFIFLEILAFVEFRTQLEIGTFILCFCIGHSMGCIKGALLLVHRKEIKKYIMSLQKGIFKPNVQRGGYEEIKIIKKAIWLARAQPNFFFGVALLVISNGVSSALLMPGFSKTIFDEDLGTNRTVFLRRLPWFTWPYLEGAPSPYYQIMLVYQVWCSATFTLIVGIIDTLVTGILVHLSAQFSILKNAIENVVRRANLHIYEHESPTTRPGTGDSLLADSGTEYIQQMDSITDKHLKQYIKECVEHHTQILVMSDNIEEQFNKLILVQFLSNTLILCFQLFVLSYVPFPSFKFLSVSAYLLLMLFQLTIYCYYGNDISIQSEKIALAVYSIQWFDADNSIKKSLMLMMLRAQRPVRLSAGKFVFLSMETLMNIIQGSISYYMVLHQMNQ